MIFHKPTLLSLVLFAGACALRAADPPGSSPAATAGSVPAAAPAMTLPLPGPQHDAMKKWSGVWDAAIKMYMPGQAEPMEAKGTWTCKMMGGFWNLCDSQSEMMGQPFFGHEIQGYDLRRKKITAYWVDTAGDWAMPMEGTASADGKTVTMWGKGYDMAGKMNAFKTVGSWLDDDHFSWKMWELVKGKKPVLTMEITYTRRK